jgi:hypothetical protein
MEYFQKHPELTEPQKAELMKFVTDLVHGVNKPFETELTQAFSKSINLNNYQGN